MKRKNSSRENLWGMKAAVGVNKSLEMSRRKMEEEGTSKRELLFPLRELEKGGRENQVRYIEKKTNINRI